MNIINNNEQIEQLTEDLEILADRIYAMDEDFTEEEIEEIEAQLCALSTSQFENAKSYLFADNELILFDEDYEVMQEKALRLKSKVLYPTEKMDNTYTRIFKQAFKMAKDLEKFENDIENVDKRIEAKRHEIVRAYTAENAYISSKALAEILKSEYTYEYLKHKAKGFSKSIDKMAIGAEVQYEKELEQFTVCFIANNKEIGLSLLDVVEYKIIYNKSFLESLNDVLMYELVYDKNLAC